MAMAEQTVDTPAIAPELLGLPLGQARRVARRHAQASVEFKLVDSEERMFSVVRQYPEAGDALAESRVIKVEIATRPWINYLPGIYQDADEVNAEVHEGEWPYPGLVIGRSSTIGKDTVLSPPVFVSQCFTVELPDRKDEISRERLRSVQALVETEKPAHAHYALVFERTEPVYERVPFLHVGKTGRIGVDARIGGLEDVPATQDEEIQRLGLGR